MNTKRIRLVVLLIALLAPARPGTLAAQGGERDVQVLLTAPQALAEIFPQAAGVATRSWKPSPAERAALEQQLGRPLSEPEYPFLLVYDGARRFLGYALVTEEHGKYRPITFMVGVTPQHTVRDVAVMVYRESRGGEVKSRRFLGQYRGKTLRNPIQANRDIINVSGATISVRSMNAGVRKTLALVEEAFGAEAPPVAAAAIRPVGSLR